MIWTNVSELEKGWYLNSARSRSGAKNGWIKENEEKRKKSTDSGFADQKDNYVSWYIAKYIYIYVFLEFSELIHSLIS